MVDSSEYYQNTTRRAVLKRVGVGSFAALGGVQTVAASESESWGQEIEPRTFEPDVSDRPAVTDAQIRIHEHGGVSKTLSIDEHPGRGRGRGKGHGQGRGGDPPNDRPGQGDPPRDVPRNGKPDEEATRTTYSLNLQEPADGVSTQSAESGDVSPADLDAALTSSETRLGGVSAEGLSEQPDLSFYDAVYYGQTRSQECGPLARTNVRRYYSWFYDDRDAVDGDACEGAQWDETFALFCPIQERYVGHCDVPSAFDTTWNVECADSDGQRAGTIFSCSNFPAVSGTVVTAHTVDASGGDVTFRSSHGILPGPDWSDLEFDVNGIANVAMDIAVLATPLGTVVAPFTWALALWLLDDEANVVR